jgi:hypothetical protein
MPEARLERTRRAYWCERCQRQHLGMFDVDHPRIIRQQVRALADEIDRRAIEAYALDK